MVDLKKLDQIYFLDKILNFSPKNPDALELILEKEENFKILNNQIHEIKSYIKNNMRLT